MRINYSTRAGKKASSGRMTNAVLIGGLVSVPFLYLLNLNPEQGTSRKCVQESISGESLSFWPEHSEETSSAGECWEDTCGIFCSPFSFIAMFGGHLSPYSHCHQVSPQASKNEKRFVSLDHVQCGTFPYS